MSTTTPALQKDIGSVRKQTGQNLKKETNLLSDYNFIRIAQSHETSWDDVVSRFIGELVKRKGKTSQDDLEWLLLNYYALPNSPALLTAGTDFFSASACSSFPIYDTMHDHPFSVTNSLGLGVRALKAGIGTGWNFSRLRSKKELVHGRVGIAAGPVGFLQSYDGFITKIKQLSREAACMGLLHVNHPDIEDWIMAKQYDKEIEKFNLTILIDDKFMKAVEEGSLYTQYWVNGDSVKDKIDARELFDKMCIQSWKNGEPAFMFEDTIKDDYFEESKDKMNILSNPCSEALLSWEFTSQTDYWVELCVLASVNYPKYEQLSTEDRRRVIRIIVSMLNDIIDVQDYICKQHETGMKEINRKIGLGIAGLATVLAKKKLPFGGKESYILTEGVFREIGEFATEKSKELGNINDLGRYNSSILSQAPTSTLSRIFDHINEEGCSYGIEPYFSIKETTIKNSMGEFKVTEKIVDYLEGQVEHIEEANRLSYKEHLVPVEAYYNSNPKGIVQGCSKTINFRNNVTVEDIKEAIMYCWKRRIKAISFYRDGSRKDQVITIKNSYRPEKVVCSEAPKRPVELECDIYRLQALNQKWIAFVGLLDGAPYEVFCGLEEKVKIPWKYEKGKISKNGGYNLILGEGDDELIINGIPTLFESKEQASLTRLISLSLRHGVPLKYCIEQLVKDGAMNAFSRAISRVLKKYIKDGEDPRMICPNCKSEMKYEGGCPTCLKCGLSKCS